MRILLNTVKKDNFTFFDPDNKVHLNRTNPLGVASELTPSLKRALIGNTVIDIDDYFKVPVTEYNRKTNDILLSIFGIVRHTRNSKDSVEVIEHADVKESSNVVKTVEEVVVEVDEEVKETTEPTKPKRKRKPAKK